jgi:hypothetical protein
MPADFYFTSVAGENERARRFLEKGISGMPAYELVGEFVTLIVPAVKSQSTTLSATEPAKFLPFLNQQNSAYQFAPHWSAVDLKLLNQLGLHGSDFQVLQSGGEIAATGVLWDQRSFKQTVIRGYDSRVALARPLLNGLSPLTKHPRLPRIGETLAGVFISHMASLPDKPAALIDLVRGLSGVASERRLEFLTLGFAAQDPRLGMIRENLRCREYRSRIYVVHWRGLGGSAAELDDRVLAPEVSLL